VTRAEEVMTLASQLHHPYTVGYVEFHYGYLRLWLRQPELVKKHALQVLHVAQQYDFPIWRALGTCLGGIADAELGRAEEGLAQVNEGIAPYQEMKTPPVFWPYLVAMNAGAHALAGKVAEGLILIDDALELAGSGDTTVTAELFLLKGDLLASAADAEAAHWFQRAFDDAGSGGGRMTQLRAALRLRLLWQNQGRNGADRLLRSVYDTFTEGFATADLTEARSLSRRPAVSVNRVTEQAADEPGQGGQLETWPKLADAFRRVVSHRCVGSAFPHREMRAAYAAGMAVRRGNKARAARRRKRRMARVVHDLTNEQWTALQAAWGGCAYCGATDKPLQRDCILALSRGGRYTLDNVVPACPSCNTSKCNDEVTGWLRRKRLDERAFLLRHIEVGIALGLHVPAEPDSAPPPPETTQEALTHRTRASGL
jgi:5-methylcytosine-specific restriction endonuclease McrA